MKACAAGCESLQAHEMLYVKEMSAPWNKFPYIAVSSLPGKKQMFEIVCFVIRQRTQMKNRDDLLEGKFI